MSLPDDKNLGKCSQQRTRHEALLPVVIVGGGRSVLVIVGLPPLVIRQRYQMSAQLLSQTRAVAAILTDKAPAAARVGRLRRVRDRLAGGCWRGWCASTSGTRGMLAGRFEPGFRIELHHKDLGIVTAAAREAGVAIPLGAAVAQLMGVMKARGHGDLDHSALLLLVEWLSGRPAS
jgi:hypothetical protein